MRHDRGNADGGRGATFSAALLAVVLLIVAPIAGCDPGGPPAHDADPAQETPSPADDAGGTRDAPTVGQTVYVPAYSEIFYQDERRKMPLATTLSIRNSDPEHSIVVTAVRYNDSSGRLVRGYLQRALVLPPLSSRAFVVDERDQAGGIGASFLVDWSADSRVSPPVIEAIMIATASTQGISFVSRGQVVRSFGE